MLEATCSGCHHHLRVKDRHAGKLVRCPQCQDPVLIPLAAEEDLERCQSCDRLFPRRSLSSRQVCTGESRGHLGGWAGGPVVGGSTTYYYSDSLFCRQCVKEHDRADWYDRMSVLVWVVGIPLAAAGEVFTRNGSFAASFLFLVALPLFLFCRDRAS